EPARHRRLPRGVRGVPGEAEARFHGSLSGVLGGVLPRRDAPMMAVMSAPTQPMTATRKAMPETVDDVALSIHPQVETAAPNRVMSPPSTAVCIISNSGPHNTQLGMS